LFSSLGTSVVASVESPSAVIKRLVLSRSLRIHLAILSAYFWRRNIIWRELTSFGTLRFTKHRKREKSHYQACNAVLKVLLLSMQQRQIHFSFPHVQLPRHLVEPTIVLWIIWILEIRANFQLTKRKSITHLSPQTIDVKIIICTTTWNANLLSRNQTPC
jgi:hypothetical protein